jgi:hypothetical protein
VDQIESTAANADLWSRYFADQWGRWLNPLGEPSPITEIAQGTGAQVAGFLSILAAGPIAWLYNANNADVAGEQHASRLEVVEKTEDEPELARALG